MLETFFFSRVTRPVKAPEKRSGIFTSVSRVVRHRRGTPTRGAKTSVRGTTTRFETRRNASLPFFFYFFFFFAERNWDRRSLLTSAIKRKSDARWKPAQCFCPTAPDYERNITFSATNESRIGEDCCNLQRVSILDSRRTVHFQSGIKEVRYRGLHGPEFCRFVDQRRTCFICERFPRILKNWPKEPITNA